jgi:3-deoxy-manno-octulosonate cytidylyltransferase (CMP-KDO synthetase)
VTLPPSALETIERLEQLRPLEAGLRIGVSVVAEAHHGVDTLADALSAERLLRIQHDLSDLRTPTYA